MDRDEGVRGQHAAAFSLVPDEDGKLRVFVDLLVQTAGSRSKRIWEHDLFVTIATVEPEKLLAMDFAAEEFQRIGQLVAGQLGVLYRLDTEK